MPIAAAGMKLLHILVLRPLRRDLLRTVLTAMAVALGVAVVVAIELAGDAATGSFLSSIQTLAGTSDLQILANGGIDETWIGHLASLPIDAHFAPIVETQVDFPTAGLVTLYGMDLVGAPHDAAILSSALARRAGVGAQTWIRLPLGSFRVDRIVDAGPLEFVVIDIAAAQKAIPRYGRLDRIDVTIGRD